MFDLDVDENRVGSVKARARELTGGPAVIAGGILVVQVMLGMTAGCRRSPEGLVPRVPEVATFTVMEQEVELTTELPGRASAYRIAEVRPQVSGLIQKRLFTEGSDVVEGDGLYEIDPAPLRAALANAEAALARAEASVAAAKVRADRYMQAFADRAVSQQSYDDAATALQLAEADARYYTAVVETARINLGYARVRSPISGRIGPSSVTDGAIVTAYQPVALATIQQMDPIYVDVPQSATETMRLRQKLEDGRITCDGDKSNEVRLLLPDGCEYGHRGTLQFRDVSVDPTTGTVILRMVFPNPDKVLLPGMFVRAVVREGSSRKAILVPQQSVSRSAKGEPLAMVVGSDGKVQQRMLTLDRAIGAKWLVTSGLAAGDRVMAEGMQKVRPGSAVKEVPFDDPNNHAGTVAGAGHGSPGVAAAQAPDDN